MAAPTRSPVMELDGRAAVIPPKRTFTPTFMLGLIVTGLFAFSALILLTSYSDELRPDDSPSASARDSSAVGYLALYRLMEAADIPVSIDPFPHEGRWDGQSIRLYFPTPAFSDARMERIAPNVPGVIVLPKWAVSPIEDGATDVVRRSDPGLSPASQAILSVIDKQLTVYNARDISSEIEVGGRGVEGIKHLQFTARTNFEYEVDEGEAAKSDEGPNSLREDLEEAVEALQNRPRPDLQVNFPTRLTGHALGNILQSVKGNDRLLILTEADLLNNQGVATQSRAQAALDVLDRAARLLDVENPTFVFDDSLRRRDVEQNLVKLLTRPPFLAATLCLIAAGLLTGWQGAFRFGDPKRASSTSPNGSETLTKAAAQFLQGSGRLASISQDYSAIMRAQVIKRLGLAAWRDPDIDAFLIRREQDRHITPTFDQIDPQNTLNPLQRAKAFQHWKRAILDKG